VCVNSLTRARYAHNPSDIMVGQSQLPPFHQSTITTVRDWWSIARWENANLPRHPKSTSRPESRGGRHPWPTTFRYETKRGEARNRIGPPTEASFAVQTGSGAQCRRSFVARRSVDVRNYGDGGRASGRPRDRSRACFHLSTEKRFYRFDADTNSGWWRRTNRDFTSGMKLRVLLRESNF